ncbi:MAG: ferritin [SAR202 cluster bacterium]|nr:ferritin [SAR202 cluster bacterium]
MNLPKVVEEALNEQINHEFYAAYLYLSMSAYCESIRLPGFAHWMRLQSAEEHSHAMKLFDFVNDRGGRVVLETIAQPPVEFQSVQDVAQRTLEHERYVTERINQLFALAVQEKDYATQVHLQWFVAEQVEEEKSASEVVDQLKQFGGRPEGLLLIDRQLAGRKGD